MLTKLAYGISTYSLLSELEVFPNYIETSAFSQAMHSHYFDRGDGLLFIWGFTSLSTLYRSYHDG